VSEDDNKDMVNATHVTLESPTMLVEKVGKCKCHSKLVVPETQDKVDS
jgi:hypothetical protein